MMYGPSENCQRQEKLLYVLPVLALEQPGEDEENAQHEQHYDADRAPAVRRGLAYVNQEIHQVAAQRVVLDRAQRAGRGLRPFVLHVLVPRQVLDVGEFERALALQRPQYVRHAYVREHGVVPSRRRLWIAIESPEVGIEPVRAA